jgi:hypothetical protein
MSELSNPPKKVRLLHVEIVSGHGVVWGDTLRLDEGDSCDEGPEGWVFHFKEKTGKRSVKVDRFHTFFISMREETVEIAPLYVPSEHKDKAPPARKVGRRVEVVN